MGIFNRLGTVIKSNVNDLISKAEDPEKMLNQAILDMNEQYNKAKIEVASAIADEKKIKKLLDEQDTKVTQWSQKAEIAVAKGDDNLAISALKRKKEYEDLANQYRAQWQAQKASVDKLKASLKELNNKIEEAKRKKNLLIAKAKRAEAQKSIQNTMASLNDNSVFDTFSRMSEKVDNLESQAEAEAELNEIMSGDELDKQFNELENQDDSLLDELSALKAKMSK